MPEPPTRERATYECSKEPKLGCYHASTSWYVSKLLASGHLRLVKRRELGASITVQ